MGAPVGNQFWKLRSKHGRDKLFQTPELLWQAACEYFQWCEANPLKEEKVFNYQGTIVRTSVDKLRAMTLSQLCFYLNCNEAYFRTFKKQLPKDEIDFNTVISEIETVIYNQKFQGASADLLNANIIARDLGLSENISQTVTIPNLPDIIIK
ncbi:MAG: terminase small subunit [Rikenellaceae bacterium]